MDTLEAITQAYVECAVWASLDDEGFPLDSEPRELAPETLEAMRATCADFLELLEREGVLWKDGWSPEQLGHDLWLTQNRHGAGFWDRYYGSDDPNTALGDRLTALAHPYGESYLYVGDDQRLYVS